MTQRERVDDASQQVETIKRNLISNMELYSYPKGQAEVQLQALMDAVVKLTQEELD